MLVVLLRISALHGEHAPASNIDSSRHGDAYIHLKYTCGGKEIEHKAAFDRMLCAMFLRACCILRRTLSMTVLCQRIGSPNLCLNLP